MTKELATLADILEAWQHNLPFREAFKQDPVKALKDYNFNVSDEILTQVKTIVRKNEELDKRINK